MAAVTTITLVGLPQTLRRLQELPQKIQKRCMMKAVRAGGAPLLKAARRNWPRLTGLSKRSLDQKVVSYGAGRVVVSIVGQRKNALIRARAKLRKGRGGISGRGDVVPVHFVEEATKPHRIPKYGRGMLILRTPAGLRAIDHVMHPGTRGQHPIRRAADSASGEAGQAFAAKLEQEVSREVDSMRTI